MVIKLLGVLENGGKPDPGIRQDVRQPIALTVGQSTIVKLHVVKRTGPPVVLAPGEVIKLVARESTARPSRKFFEVTITSTDTDPLAGPGHYKATIATTATRGLGGLSGVYDVWLDTTGGASQVVTVEPIIPVSELAIRGSAADAPTVP